MGDSGFIVGDENLGYIYYIFHNPGRQLTLSPAIRQQAFCIQRIFVRASPLRLNLDTKDRWDSVFPPWHP